MLRRPRTALLAAAGALAALPVIWFAAFQLGFGHKVDSLVLHGFVDLRRPRTVGPMEQIVHLANPEPFAVMATLIVVVALLRRRPAVALALGVAMLGANASSQLLKSVLADPRFSDFLGSGGQISAVSWPSGHATAAMSVALAAVVVCPARWRPWAAALGAAFAIGVGYCVLALGWHYPSDVLGGYLIAAVWILAAVAALLARREEAPRARPVVSVSAALTVPVAMAAVAVGAVLAALIVRPSPVMDYMRGHTTFAVGALAIGALALALATALSVGLRGEARRYSDSPSA